MESRSLKEEESKSLHAWPVAFIVLNYECEIRAKSKNCLLASFVPGDHDSSHFDSFLQPTIDELMVLQRGVPTACADGHTRNMKAHVVFLTGDMPAMSKILGFAGHNATSPCRFCHFKAVRVEALRSICCVPEVEEAPLRTSEETKRLWSEADALLCSGTAAQRGRFMKASGIKRKPALSSLQMNFTHGAPHDPMHLLLLGWVKHVATLFVGKDDRCKGKNCSHIINEEKRGAIDDSLRAGFATTPSSWGRPPLELSKLSSYKAEDWKMLGSLYGPSLFNTKIAGPEVAQLWSSTSKILQICFNPFPQRTDVEELKQACKAALDLFAKIFYHSEDHAYCFTPTTHGITHLHQNLSQCGPLLNLSQYVVERLVGELSAGVKSRKHPETQMLSSYQMRFSLQFAQQENAVEELGGRPQKRDEVVAAGGQGLSPAGRSVRELVMKWAVEDAGSTPLEVEDLAVVAKASIRRGEAELCIESKKSFDSRRARSPGARQRCFVAAHFRASQAAESELSSDEDAEADGKVAVWHGLVKDLVKTRLRSRGEGEEGEAGRSQRLVAVVEWEEGLKVDPVTSLPYSTRKRGRVWRGGSVSAISIELVERLIGYLELEEGGLIARHYIDPDHGLLDLANPSSNHQL